MSRTVVKRTAAAAAAAVGLLLVYGVAVEPRLVLDERQVTAVLPGLDESWEGERLAVFADMQIGTRWSAAPARRPACCGPSASSEIRS